MYPEEILGGLEARVTVLEELVERLTNALRFSLSMADVNVAGGEAYNELRGGA